MPAGHFSGLVIDSSAKMVFKWCKSDILAAICLCKLGGQELKFRLGTGLFGFSILKLGDKSLVPNLYSKMPLELYRAIFFRNSLDYIAECEINIIVSRKITQYLLM